MLKREKLVLDWRKRQQSRAQVRVTVEKILDRGLPEVYTEALFQQKTESVFQHIYESYYGAGKGIYAAVM
jgi:type I restriction enzyme R subunit